MEGWHFLRADGCLNYPPHTRVEVGRTLTVQLPLKLCEHGLHASRRAIDALGYGPGAIVCRVRLGGSVFEDGDKAVATERTVIWMADATVILYEFACWAAEAERRLDLHGCDDVPRLVSVGPAAEHALQQGSHARGGAAPGQ